MASGNKKIKNLFYQTGCLGSIFKMSAKKYRKYTLNYVANSDIKARALKKHGIDESEVTEVEPLIIWGYEFNCTPKQTKHPTYVDSSGSVKTLSPMVVQTVLLFSDSRVYVYSYGENFATGSHIEQTEEYSYKDIVNIATYEESENIMITKKKSRVVEYTVLRMTVPGDKMVYAYIPDAASETRLKAIKNKIKEKKE